MTDEEAAGDALQPYRDLLDRPRPPSRHPRLSAAARAAQFLPYEAWEGLRDELGAAAVDAPPPPGSRADRQTYTDAALAGILMHDPPRAQITYYRPPTGLTVGQYRQAAGVITHVDAEARTLTLDHRVRVPLDDITDLRPVGEPAAPAGNGHRPAPRS